LVFYEELKIKKNKKTQFKQKELNKKNKEKKGGENAKSIGVVSLIYYVLCGLKMF
jgi:uncharacterized protein YfdQ (DUF2303 family)